MAVFGCLGGTRSKISSDVGQGCGAGRAVGRLDHVLLTSDGGMCCAVGHLIAATRYDAILTQVAALAEFRKDWQTALRSYEAAYRQLQAVPGGGQLPVQRFFEALACSELLHFKVRTSTATT